MERSYQEISQQSGVLGSLGGWPGRLVRYYCAVIVFYHLYAAQFGAPEALFFRATHVAFFVSLVFLIIRIKPSKVADSIPLYDYALAVAAFIPVGYLYFDFARIVSRYPYITALTPVDWAMGIAMIALTAEACRRAVGGILVVLMALFIFHALFGEWFPGRFSQMGIKPNYLIDHLYLTTSGLYSAITGISATHVFMFVLLGAMLERARGGDLFMNVAIGIMGRQAGGPGKAAVLASGMFGSITGSAIANVYATGAFTIPLMKRTGFRPRFAAAVEAVASSSGQLVPPIMGSAAFLIADFTRTRYVDVAWAALWPAVLFLFAIYVMVHLETRKDGLPAMSENQVSNARRQILHDAHVALALVAVVYLLVLQRTPFYAAYVGLLATIALSMLRSHTRLTPGRILDAFETGTRRIASVAPALFVAGIIVGTIELTGLGLRFTSIFLSITGGLLFPTLLLVMISCLILGMGLPTTAAYLVVAIFGAPALIALDINPMAAHLFVFYYAILSGITPPIAMVAYAAATIAGSPMQATAVTALKVGAAVYIVPFVMVYNPALIMAGEWPAITLAVLTAAVGVVSLAGAVLGYLLCSMTWLERGLAFGSALCLLVGGIVTDLAGTALLLIVVAVQALRMRRVRPTLE